MPRPILAILLFCLLASCQQKNKLTVLTDHYEKQPAGNSVVRSLSHVLQPVNIHLQEVVDTASQERILLEQVSAGKADMAIVKNDIVINDSLSDLRTVMPLFPDVLLILYKKDEAHPTLTGLMQQGQVMIITDKQEELPLINSFLEHIRLEPAHVTHLKNSQEPRTIKYAVEHGQVIILFSSLNNPQIAALLKEHADFTLYEIAQPQEDKGSVINGFCMKFPQVIPHVIPAGIFRGFPEKPIYTFATYDVLVCHKNIQPEVIYDLSKSIFHAEARLAQDNFEFGMLTENFNNHTFIFPLHEGTLDYLNRNQPSFWERYSEFLGLIVTILVVSGGAVSTIYRKLQQRKKDKIDEYYKKVIDIGDKAHSEMITGHELRKMLFELFVLRNRAFQLLVDERIDANNSFVIFLLLLQSTVQYIESRADQYSIKDYAILPFEEIKKADSIED